MALNTVAILSPGDMGHAVGQTLREHELRVVTCLTGRSGRTRVLSEKAGIEDVPNFAEMVAQSDLIMSMTVSGAVPEICRQVAEAVIETGHTDLLFAECNAIAPGNSPRNGECHHGIGGQVPGCVHHRRSPTQRAESQVLCVGSSRCEEFEQLRDFGPGRQEHRQGDRAGLRHQDVLRGHDQGIGGACIPNC